MKNKSAYWLSHTPTEKFNLIELAHTQRAISNFVKILTKKEIPVEFFEQNQGDSMTDGKKIAISSTINMHNIDSVVGLALHEGAHCKHTDFFVLKKIANRLLEVNLMGGRRWIELLLNFIGWPMASTCLYDEVQMIYYPLNHHAGNARGMTTASLPIPMSRVEKVIVDQLNKNSNISVQSFFNLIERKIL